MAGYGDPNTKELLYGIVVHGGYGDTEYCDPEQSGGVKVILPHLEGPQVNSKHKAWSRNSSSGTHHGATNNNPPPENGTAVLCYKQQGWGGTNHLTISHTIPDIAEDSNIPGNAAGGSWANPALEKARNFIMPMLNMPPKAGSGEADSRPPVEKGSYNTNMTKGIISTAALAPLMGMVIPQVKNVSTATQAFSQILTSGMLGSMPGMNMSIGSLFDNMPSELKSAIMSSIPQNVGNALNSISNLMQTIEIVESGSFNTATKVNPDVFFKNAADLLSKARDTAGIVSAFSELQTNTSLAGLDSLPSISVNIEGGPFGTIPLSIDPLGNITSNIPEGIQKLIDLFSSLMSDGAGFPGVFPGQNMFGESSQVLNNMFNRLKPEEMTKAVTQMQKNVAPGGDPRKAVNEIHKFAASAETLGLAALNKLG